MARESVVPQEDQVARVDEEPSFDARKNAREVETGPDSARGRTELELPRTIGRFAVLRKLGEGGMGMVVSSYDEALRRRVAIKVLKPLIAQMAGEDSLLREAQALAKLSHPNVVHVYEVGRHRGGVYIAMEYVEGVNLSTWRKLESRPWTEVVKHFVEAGRGLAAAHDADLVHRGFKPSNVLLGTDGRVRVLDFSRRGGRSGPPIIRRSRRSISHEPSRHWASETANMPSDCSWLRQRHFEPRRIDRASPSAMGSGPRFGGTEAIVPEPCRPSRMVSRNSRARRRWAATSKRRSSRNAVVCAWSRATRPRPARI